MSSTVLVFLAEGFEEIEALAPVDIMRRAQIPVVMISVSGSREVTGARGITVKADDILSGDVDSLFEKYQPMGVFIPGGPGAKILRDHSLVVAFVRRMNDDKKIIAAICAAPIVLEAAGIMRDRPYTCYPGYEKDISGLKQDKALVTDQNVITGNGPGSAFLLGLELVRACKTPAAAEVVAKAMMIR